MDTLGSFFTEVTVLCYIPRLAKKAAAFQYKTYYYCLEYFLDGALDDKYI